MKRTMRYLSALLALILCLSLVSAGAMAASEEPELEALEEADELAAEIVEQADEPAAAEATGEPEPDDVMSITAAAEAYAEPALDAAAAEEDHTAAGDWGENFTWTVSGGVMTVSGEGEMYGNQPSYGDWVEFVPADIVSAVIEDGATSVGTIFQNFPNLRSVTIPASVKKINPYAFYGCVSLAEVNYAGDMSSLVIGDYNDCFLLPAGVGIDRSGDSEDGLRWAVKNDVLTISGQGDMKDYDYGTTTPWESSSDSIRAIVIEEGVTSIGRRAFSYFERLVRVTLPVSVTRIGSSAFESSSLQTVEYAGTEAQWRAVEIGSSNGPLLMAAPYPASDGGTFGDGLAWRLDGTTLTITGSGDMPDYEPSNILPWSKYRDVVKTAVIGDGITSVGDRAFYHLVCLESVAIPNGVTRIGAYAFGITVLESIELPAGLLTIGDRAFMFTVLESIELPAGLLTIGDDAFMGCHSLTSVVIPKSVTRIGARAFGDSGLTSVRYDGTEADWSAIDIGDYNGILWALTGFRAHDAGAYGGLAWELDGTTLTITGQGAMPEPNDGYIGGGPMAEFDPNAVVVIPWAGYGDLVETVVIGDGVTSVCDKAFQSFGELRNVTLPNSVTSIGWAAFEDCWSLAGLELPAGLVSIGERAFGWCYSLESVTLPDSVTSVGDRAFEGCYMLQSAVLSKGMTNIPQRMFMYCTALEDVTIPAGITSVGFAAFSLCESLESVTLPEGVVSVDGNAFYGCRSLASVTLPASLESIGQGAFSLCKDLRDVYYAGTQEQWDALSVGADNIRLANATVHIGWRADAGVRLEVGEPEETEAILAELVEELVAGTGAQTLDERTAAALRAAAAENKEITAQVVIAAIEAGAVAPEDAALIGAAAGEDEVLAHLDLSVKLLADGEVIGSVSETGKPIRFSVELSEAQLEQLGGKGVYVVRVHDGQAQTLSTTLQGRTVYFESDSFSVYAVVAHEHIWGEWTVTREATYVEAGEKTHICSICGQTEIQTIPMLAPVETEPPAETDEPGQTQAPDETGTPAQQETGTAAPAGTTNAPDEAARTAPKTGDESEWILWAALFGLCTAGAAAVLPGGKRKKD